MSSVQAFGRQMEYSPIFNLTPVVFIIGHEPCVLGSLDHWIRSEGWRPKTLKTARDLFDETWAPVPSCLILDTSLFGWDGFEAQRRIRRERPEVAVIVLSGFERTPIAIRPRGAGAVDFLTKPLKRDVLIAAIREGLDRSALVLKRDAELPAVRSSYPSLAPRGRQATAFVV